MCNFEGYVSNVNASLKIEHESVSLSSGRFSLQVYCKTMYFKIETLLCNITTEK